MADHIFICYSHKDAHYARRLADALEDQGFSVWIDKRIAYGSRWPRAIEKHIDECSAFILLMTKEARASDWVQNELIHARDRGKKIYPLLLKGETAWLDVKSLQYVDVRDGALPPPRFYKHLAEDTPKRVIEHEEEWENKATVYQEKTTTQPIDLYVEQRTPVVGERERLGNDKQNYSHTSWFREPKRFALIALMAGLIVMSYGMRDELFTEQGQTTNSIDIQSPVEHQSDNSLAPKRSSMFEPVPQPHVVEYTIMSGDHLLNVARFHAMTLEELLALNPEIVKGPNALYIGETIKVYSL